MKIFKLSLIAFTIIIPLSIFAFEPLSLPFTVDKKNYKATIGSDGYIASVEVAGKEFLAKDKNIPGGFFLCAGITPKLENLKRINKNCVEGYNQIAKLTYKFEDDKIIIGISEMKKKGSLYIVINQAVKKVSYGADNAVPTTATTPANAQCGKTCWFLDGASLYINGNNSIWGPWKGHQVWDAKLIPGKTLTIEMIPGKENVPADHNVLKSSGVKENSGKEFTYGSPTVPAQIPLCMVGDSITWAGEGDYWRKYLLEKLPCLAFVGTHSAVLGYSHAGEGGNSTSRVLSRINAIPDCPYYSLMIGTNDTGVKDESKCRGRAEQTAGRIQKIVFNLLKKKGVKKVFLCSILPCSTNNPLRDKTNSLTNVILRKKMQTVFPKEKVVWVEFEVPVRAIKDWASKIKLHPSLEGYKIIAGIHAEAIAKALHINDLSKKVVPRGKTGVRINNLWNKEAKMTSIPVIAGWYTLSFKLDKITSKNPEIEIICDNHTLGKPFKLSLSDKGKRITLNFFTGYEGYGYKRSYLKLKMLNCEISRVLFEKARPSQKASVYGEGIYMDTKSEILPGELVEAVAPRQN